MFISYSSVIYQLWLPYLHLGTLHTFPLPGVLKGAGVTFLNLLSLCTFLLLLLARLSCARKLFLPLLYIIPSLLVDSLPLAHPLSLLVNLIMSPVNNCLEWPLRVVCSLEKRMFINVFNVKSSKLTKKLSRPPP